MKAILIILVSVQLFANQCDKLYEFFLNHRESSHCSAIKSSLLSYDMMVQHKCVLDGTDKDFYSVLTDEFKINCEVEK